MTIKFFKYPKLIKLLLIIYIIGFSIGTFIHAASLIKYGFLPYTNAPLWKNIYWTLLTFFDFLVIILLFEALIPAIAISNVIMISDVIINSIGNNILDDYRVILQIIFGLYIIITTPIIFVKYGNYKRNIKR